MRARAGRRADPGGLREPRRPDDPRLGRGAAGPRRLRLRKRRRVGLRGVPRGARDRHVSARALAAAESLARRLAARAGAWPPDGRGSRVRATARRSGSRGAHGLLGSRPHARGPLWTCLALPCGARRRGAVARPRRSSSRPGHDSPVLRGPERAEVDTRIAGLPARKEALDRRGPHDLVEFADHEKPVAAHGCVLGCHLLQRAAREVAGEDDVHDVLPGERARGRDRVDERHRAFEVDVLVDPDLLVHLATKRLQQAFARMDAAPGEQPVALVALLVTAEQHPVAPPQHGRHADPGLAGHTPDEPKPATPRCVSGSSSTSTGSAAATGTTTSWAMRIPGSTVKLSARSWFTSTTRTSPR